MLPTINELPQRSDLSKQEIRLNFYCYCTFFCLLERGGEKDALPESCQTTELRSFRRKVDSPDRVRQEMSRFARWPTTLYNIVNIPVEVLLKLPLDSACEVTVFLCLFPFFRLKERQIRFGRIDLVWTKLLSREPTFGQNDLTPNYWITAARTAGQVNIIFSRQIWFSKARIHFFVNQWS